MKEHFCPAEQSTITYQGKCNWCGEIEGGMIEIIKDILTGIDQTEIESSDGWWETSTGAKFGAEKLKQIVEALAQEQDEDAIIIQYHEATIKRLEKRIEELLAQTQEPWCMKMNDCKTKCEDCPDEPPQHTERPVDCERCNRLEEQAYDLVGKLRVANIKLSMQPQRTWVDLTDEELKSIEENTTFAGNESFLRALTRNIEAKLKELNT